MTLSPFVGVLASGWNADGFTETGAGAFNATLADQSAYSLRTQAGLEGTMSWNVGTVVLHPHFRAAWLHEFANGANGMDAAFGPVTYTVSTRRPQRDSALVGAG